MCRSCSAHDDIITVIFLVSSAMSLSSIMIMFDVAVVVCYDYHCICLFNITMATAERNQPKERARENHIHKHKYKQVIPNRVSGVQNSKTKFRICQCHAMPCTHIFIDTDREAPRSGAQHESKTFMFMFTEITSLLHFRSNSVSSSIQHSPMCEQCDS